LGTETYSKGEANKGHEGAETMPNVELVPMERGLRGKGNEGKKITYQGISETAPRPDNPLDAALQLVTGDMQAFWDRYVVGFNECAYEALADPIAKYLDDSWDDDKKKNFRLTVNAMSKFLGKDKDEVAEIMIKQGNL
jgi:hypothetical protein